MKLHLYQEGGYFSRSCLTPFVISTNLSFPGGICDLVYVSLHLLLLLCCLCKNWTQLSKTGLTNIALCSRILSRKQRCRNKGCMRKGEGGQATAFAMRYWLLHLYFIHCYFMWGRLKKIVTNMKKSQKVANI